MRVGSCLRRYFKNREAVRGWAMAARTCLLAGIALSLPGCMSFGPPSVDRDRFDYINAISSSWKQQTLLNISETSCSWICSVHDHVSLPLQIG